MFNLQFGIESSIICTLTENVTLDAPLWYRFSFYNNETGATVDKVYSSAVDESPFPERYNEFLINPDVDFAGKQPGQWSYKVYQQATEIEAADEANLIETGIMILHKAAVTTPKVHQPSLKSIKIFNGN
jgi:hypothetical protein